MIRTDARLRVCTGLTLCVLTFIWGNSLLPAEISQRLSDWLKSFLAGDLSGGTTGGSGLLRKIAHFTEFAALGFCLGWLFGMLGRGWGLPLVLGFGAACVDEGIQLFVPGRGPGLTDVALDTAGVAAGLGLLYIGYHIIKKKQKINLEDTIL